MNLFTHSFKIGHKLYIALILTIIEFVYISSFIVPNTFLMKSYSELYTNCESRTFHLVVGKVYYVTRALKHFTHSWKYTHAATRPRA